MTAWTTISNLLVAVGAKPFATTIQALRDNPVAIAEGATGAPRIHPAALDTYRLRTSLNGTTAVQYLSLDRFLVLRIDAALGAQNSAAGAGFEVAFSNNNGATWGSWQSLSPFQPSNSTTSTLRRDLVGTLHISLVTGSAAYRMTLAGNVASGEQPAIIRWGILSLTVPANCNAVRFRYSSAASNNGLLDLEGISGVPS